MVNNNEKVSIRDLIKKVEMVKQERISLLKEVSEIDEKVRMISQDDVLLSDSVYYEMFVEDYYVYYLLPGVGVCRVCAYKRDGDIDVRIFCKVNIEKLSLSVLSKIVDIVEL